MSNPNPVHQQQVYQLKISLKRNRPPIWRRIEVVNTITLNELHRIIQILFNWNGYHLHQFTDSTNNIDYTDPAQGEAGYPTIDENTIQIKSILTTVKSKFNYIYDFGDYWEHIIELESINNNTAADPEIFYPRLITGRLAAPIEDDSADSDSDNSDSDPKSKLFNKEEIQNKLNREFNTTSSTTAATKSKSNKRAKIK